jgi:hypothetical protein
VVADLRLATDSLEHLARAGHLGHRLGGDERAELDLRHPGGGHPLDELGALGRGQDLRLVLETIAGTHVDKGDTGWKVHMIPRAR